MNPKTFTVGQTQFTINYVKGKVVGKDKNMETKISGGGGGGYSYQGTGASASFSVSSKTIVHDKMYLELANGKEASVELKDWDIAFREGHYILAVWIDNLKTKKSKYVLIKNFTTDNTWTSGEDIDILSEKPDSLFESAGCMNALFLLGVAATISYFIGSVLVGYNLAALFIPIPVAWYFFDYNKKKVAYKNKANTIKQELNAFVATIQE